MFVLKLNKDVCRGKNFKWSNILIRKPGALRVINGKIFSKMILNIIKIIAHAETITGNNKLFYIVYVQNTNTGYNPAVLFWTL